MSVLFRNGKGEKVEVESSSFAKGGEGEVYRINTPKYADCCAKVYHKSYCTSGREQKIQYMINKSPQVYDRYPYMLCWPTEMLYDNVGFRGFIMPLAFEGSIELYDLCSYSKTKNMGVEWSEKYDRKKQSITDRLKLCVNLSIAVHSVHALESYVFVDLKPKNILVSLDGKVSVIDCDSVQITEDHNVQFCANVATAEYSPPESEKLTPAANEINKSWDYFSLGVIIYEILFGIHPYAATFTGKYEKCISLDEKIAHGLYVYGNKKNYLRKLPEPHKTHDKTPKAIRDYFYRTFEIGNSIPNKRTSAQEWGMMLTKVINELPPVDIKNAPRLNSEPTNQHFVVEKLEVKNDQGGIRQTKYGHDLKKLLFGQLFGCGLHMLYDSEYISRKVIYPISFLIMVAVQLVWFMGGNFYADKLIFQSSLAIVYGVGYIDVILSYILREPD